MISLRSARLERGGMPSPSGFPFSVPIIASLGEVEFSAPVTFLVGENGCGKSTLLEALAMAAERGFFLRAEDFFGYAKRVADLAAEAERELVRVDQEYKDRSEYARGLARGPHAKALTEIRALYGDGLDAQSHGESFLKLFQSRLAPNGVYFLDEPEVPLSPLRQLAFLALLRAAVDDGSQFVIATHSPILLALPDAEIWSCDTAPPARVAWAELEHVTLTRSFLNDPENYLRRL